MLTGSSAVTTPQEMCPPWCCEMVGVSNARRGLSEREARSAHAGVAQATLGGLSNDTELFSPSIKMANSFVYFSPSLFISLYNSLPLLFSQVFVA